MNRPRITTFFRGLVGLLFVLAGAMHFIKPDFYLTIMPAFLPYPLELVKISGAFEILGGIGLLIPGVRRQAGCGLIALLLAVLPANINMLVQDMRQEGFSFITVILLLRLPLQFVFMAIVNRLSKNR